METPTTFTWDIDRGLPEVFDDGSQYVYGAGLISQVAGANTYYYLADGLGSVMATTDASGSVVNGYTYDVYGAPTSSSGSQANDREFAGQQTDPTGLQYLRARYYDPATGSFLSRDPLSAEPSWLGSPFVYAGASPADYSDPTGLCSWWDVQCHLQGLAGLNDSEMAYCSRGPRTLGRCIKAQNDANDAVNTVSLVFPEQDTDLTAAFRHCLWSAFMTYRWGTGQAQIFGDRHEDFPENPENVKAMGLWNNAVGRSIGEYYRGRQDAHALVTSECLRATFDGRLITDRHLFDIGGFEGGGDDSHA